MNTQYFCTLQFKILYIIAVFSILPFYLSTTLNQFF